VADQLSKILIERALSGIAVFLLYDAFGAGGLKRSYLRAMRDAGVRVVAFRPLRFRNLWVVQNRSHIRGIVIDRRVGWTGGFGVDDKWLGDGQTDLAWRDTNIRFEGPAVYQLQAAFAAAWAEATGELFSGRVAVTYQDDGVEAAGLLATTPTLGSTAAERFLALSIAGAQKKLFITNAYFAPDRSFVALLVAAADRGVDVRVLLGGPRTDVRVARRAAHSRYDRLLVAGVRVYEYQPSTLHAKTFVVDGCWTAVGTMNFDNRSLALNDECTLMVLDKTFGSQMEDVFLADLGRSAQINLQEFRKRPPLYILHGDKHLAFLLSDFIDSANIRVIQRRRVARLVAEALDALRILHNLCGKKLERYRAPQSGVFRPVHYTHPAAAQRIK